MEGPNRYYSNQSRPSQREINRWRDPYNRKGDYHQPEDNGQEGQNWTSNYPTSDAQDRHRDFSAQNDVRWPAGDNYVSPSKWQERDHEPGMRPGYFNHYQSDYAQRSQEQGAFAGRGPKGYQRSDERIREDVCEALMRSAQVDASNIEVEVKDAIVTLKGTVDQRRMKRLAEDCAERVLSVRDIRNEITLSDSDRAESMLSPRANSTVNKAKKEPTDDSVGKSMN